MLLFNSTFSMVKHTTYEKLEVVGLAFNNFQNITFIEFYKASIIEALGTHLADVLLFTPHHSSKSPRRSLITTYKGGPFHLLGPYHQNLLCLDPLH